MAPPAGNIPNGPVWYTIVFKVSAFCQHFLGKKLKIETIYFKNPKINSNNDCSSRTVVFVTLLSVKSLCV